MAGRFDGTFTTDGGSLFQGNTFNANGGPIYFESGSDSKPPARIRELPDFILSPCFTGRSDELQHIDHVLNASSSNYPQRCVIHGMPGVGKTQLALQYATLAFQRAQHPYVFWVSAMSVGKLFRDFSKLADLARLPKRHSVDQSSKINLVRAWLEDATPAKSWLMVLDNVSEETVEALREVMPRGDCGGRLLMTTRTTSIANAFTDSKESSHLALQPLKTNEAIAMLSAGIKIGQENRESVDHTDAERLVKSVGNLPLAIDQAASYIRETGTEPQAVLTISEGEHATEIFSWENDLSRHEEKSVIATFMPALVRIKESAPDALTLLRLFCFCDPEGIPISIFMQGSEFLSENNRKMISESLEVKASKPVSGLRRLFKKVHNDSIRKRQSEEIPTRQDLGFVANLLQSPLRLSKAIQEIQRLSLAAQVLEGTERIIRIHDLVNLLLRSKLMEDTERIKWFNIALLTICRAFREIDDHKSPQNWDQCSRFTSHIESMAGFAEQHELESIEIVTASACAASYLRASGHFQKAATMSRWTVNQAKTILGEKHPFVLGSMGSLASVLGDQGQYKEAEQIQRQALAQQELVLGKQHRETLTSKNNLALLLNLQGKSQEAEQIYRPTLALLESVLGKQHPNTLGCMSNLASVLESQGQYKEVEQIHRQTIALKESVLGKQHPDTLTSMNNLALTLEKQGQYEEAEHIHRQTLAQMETILGKQHPRTLQSMRNLAWTLHRQGRYEEAVALLETCVRHANRVFGPDHPYTQMAHENLHTWKGQKSRKYFEGAQSELQHKLRRTASV